MSCIIIPDKVIMLNMKKQMAKKDYVKLKLIITNEHFTNLDCNKRGRRDPDERSQPEGFQGHVNDRRNDVDEPVGKEGGDSKNTDFLTCLTTEYVTDLWTINSLWILFKHVSF